MVTHKFLIPHWVLGMQALSFRIHWPCRIACDYTLIQLSIQSYRKCESISEAVQLHLYVTNLDWTGYNYQSAAEAQFINTAFAHHFLTKIVGAVHQSIIIMCHFFASNTCQKWTTKNPRPLVITIPPEVHVSTPMTLQIISSLAAWKLPPVYVQQCMPELCDLVSKPC